MAVPYITLAHRDRSYRPVWGRIDARRLREILNRRLCQVCGTPLTDQVVVFLRPAVVALAVYGIWHRGFPEPTELGWI